MIPDSVQFVVVIDSSPQSKVYFNEFPSRSVDEVLKLYEVPGSPKAGPVGADGVLGGVLITTLSAPDQSDDELHLSFALARIRYTPPLDQM